MFKTDKVVEGLDLAVRNMSINQRCIVEIPPELAYGKQTIP